MQKKEAYRRHLPHFQVPGQEYFVTWCLLDAIPPKALLTHTRQIKDLQRQLEASELGNDLDKILEIKAALIYRQKQYLKALNDLLDLPFKNTVNLSKLQNRSIVLDTLCFWEGKKIQNYAICVMGNHVHWVFRTFETDENNQPVYLQDIMQSVKRYSANKINQAEGRKGSVWGEESYDVTIRNDVHLEKAINYTLNNPVKAGLVKQWQDWPGTMCFV